MNSLLDNIMWNALNGPQARFERSEQGEVAVRCCEAGESCRSEK